MSEDNPQEDISNGLRMVFPVRYEDLLTEEDRARYNNRCYSSWEPLVLAGIRAIEKLVKKLEVCGE